MQSQLEAIEPGSFGGLLRYLGEGHRHYHLSLERFVGRNFYNRLQYFSPQNLPLLFQLKALVKHYDNIGNYFQDPHLKAAFTFQNMYLGLSPYEAPATYSLLQYTELADGVWFPMGGLYRVIESLVAIAQEHGVSFQYGKPLNRSSSTGPRLRRTAARRRTDGCGPSGCQRRPALCLQTCCLTEPEAEAPGTQGLHLLRDHVLLGHGKEIPPAWTPQVFLSSEYRGASTASLRTIPCRTHPASMSTLHRARTRLPHLKVKIR